MTKFYDSYKAVFDAIKTALVVCSQSCVPAHDEVPRSASSRCYQN